MIARFGLVVILISLCNTNAAAKEVTLILQGAPIWDLRQDATADFATFLDEQRQWLLDRLPDLEFPETFTSFPDAFAKYAFAGGQEFRNRRMACSFLERLSQALVDENDRLALEKLRHEGEVCIPGDLTATERGTWTLLMIRIIWDGRWVPQKNSEPLSLEQHLIKALDLKDYERPEFRLLTYINLDGYGYNYSPGDRHFIAQQPLLNELYNLTSHYDINDPASLGDFGEEFNAAVLASQASTGGMFITRPTIYLSENWDPASLVELLAHEFGHVYHGGKNPPMYIKAENSTFTWRAGDNIHGEGAAEAMAWNGLHAIYDSFPEIKYFHIFKLHLFTQLRPADNHLVGASAFASLFHRDVDPSVKEQQNFDQFVRSEGLSSFMNAVGFSTLERTGTRPDERYHLVWGP